MNEVFLTGPFVYNTIRAVHPYTPILIFGGHSHIRDCRTSSVHKIFKRGSFWQYCHLISVQFDGRSMALESGRYMETVGSWIIHSGFFLCSNIMRIGWMSMLNLSKSELVGLNKHCRRQPRRIKFQQESHLQPALPRPESRYLRSMNV